MSRPVAGKTGMSDTIDDSAGFVGCVTQVTEGMACEPKNFGCMMPEAINS
jgi:hypothetical protein